MTYSNLTACLEIIRQSDLTEADKTYSVFADLLLKQLLDTLPSPQQHLEMLEVIREPLTQVQGVLAQRYAARVFPVSAEANQALTKVIQLWRLLARSYTHVMRRMEADGSLNSGRSALLLQRRVLYSGLVLLEYFRGGRDLPASAWLTLNRALLMAEEKGCAHTRVNDSMNSARPEQSAVDTFCMVLLVDLARPYGRNSFELAWITRWAQYFAQYCTVEALVRDGDARKRYGLDLNADYGLRPASVLEQAADSRFRCFNGDRLAEQIRDIFARFKKGVLPPELGLGEGLPVSTCARLLFSLYRPWGAGAAIYAACGTGRD